MIIVGYYTFYMTEIVNYYTKSLLVYFGYVNNRGQIKQSAGSFVPKKLVQQINFQAKTITIAGWWYARNGHLWRYRVDKCQGHAVDQLEVKNFVGDSINNFTIPGMLDIISASK